MESQQKSAYFFVLQTMTKKESTSLQKQLHETFTEELQEIKE